MLSLKNTVSHPLFYAVEVILGMSAVWYISSNLLGIFEMPLWGLFSFVGTIERDIRFMSLNSKQRFIHSVLGVALTFIAISLFGTGFWALFFAYVTSVFICNSFYYYPGNWKLAPATALSLIFFIHTSQGVPFTITWELGIARLLEVIVGCSVAIIETYLFSKLIVWLHNKFGKTF